MKTCEHCKKPFEKRYAESKKQYSLRKFCSRDCANVAKVGRLTSDETKEKLRLLAIGRKNSEASKEKVRGENSYRWKGGKPKCISCGEELANIHAKRCVDCYKKYSIGENSAHWQGGITPINTKIRNSKETENWRKAVFERDNYTCCCCGELGGHLHAHHIVPFSVDKLLRHDINNGQTLCRECHKMVHSGINGFKNPKAIIKGAIA